MTVMTEAGISMAGARSKHLNEWEGLTFDYVVTVCDGAREQCPVFPGARKTVHMDFADPPRLAAGSKTEEEALAAYRKIRDEIRDFVLKLPEILF